MVEVQRNDDRWEELYMFYNQDFLVAREEAKEEGKAEGKEKGRWESAKEIRPPILTHLFCPLVVGKSST